MRGQASMAIFMVAMIIVAVIGLYTAMLIYRASNPQPPHLEMQLDSRLVANELLDALLNSPEGLAATDVANGNVMPGTVDWTEINSLSDAHHPPWGKTSKAPVMVSGYAWRLVVRRVDTDWIWEIPPVCREDMYLSMLYPDCKIKPQFCPVGYLNSASDNWVEVVAVSRVIGIKSGSSIMPGKATLRLYESVNIGEGDEVCALR